ncbi:hypothetical protein [Rhodococcus sp. YH1]|uniref:hypothetical protein n=1 Tax=Rhodococcus sp. YH1 TaxID=89066 RepID=UPI001A0177C6|nr:hypothetical protein [Rhodococcus sp. YH1]
MKSTESMPAMSFMSQRTAISTEVAPPPRSDIRAAATTLVIPPIHADEKSTGYVGHVADLVACVRPDLDRSRSLAVAATVVSLVEGAAIVHSAVGVGRSAEARSEIIRAAVGLVHGP